MHPEDDPFVDRERETALLDSLLRKHGSRGALVVVYGRRRVGKSRLLREWVGAHGGAYSQAVEGAPALQLAAVYADLAPRLDPRIEPRSWEDLFTLLDAQRKRPVVCIDEFPYLVAADPSVPSRMQKWLDARGARPMFLVLAGSSTRMMHGAALAADAPLYGRAVQTFRLEPMGFHDFCRARGARPSDPDAFLKFALVGGVPKYWEFCGRDDDAVSLASALYFRDSPYMEGEPGRLLADEMLVGLGPVSVLEAVGRGAERPNEIAARMAAKQSTLSKVLGQLVDASILRRDVPFGESERNAKRTLYRIADPAVRFWYRVASPHHVRWEGYSREHKLALIREHAGTVFEDLCRSRHPGSRRYWEGSLEFDCVWQDERRGTVHVAEAKLGIVSKSEQARIVGELSARWARSKLAARFPRVEFEVCDARLLREL